MIWKIQLFCDEFFIQETQEHREKEKLWRYSSLPAEAAAENRIIYTAGS